MIWGVGTGRCGTRSLAADLEGVHEPQPWFTDEPVRYLLYGLFEEQIKERLKERLSLGVHVVDLTHSFVMPLIREVDPSAVFYWPVRDPFAFCCSILAGWQWTDNADWGVRQLKPPTGWGEVERLDKAIYHWRRTNAVIFENIDFTNGDKILLTENLKNWENKYPPDKKLNFTAPEARKIAETCWREYEFYKDLANAS